MSLISLLEPIKWPGYVLLTVMEDVQESYQKHTKPLGLGLRTGAPISPTSFYWPKQVTWLSSNSNSEEIDSGL